MLVSAHASRGPDAVNAAVAWGAVAAGDGELILRGCFRWVCEHVAGQFARLFIEYSRLMA